MLWLWPLMIWSKLDVQKAEEILGKQEAKNWLYRKIPSLGDQIPMDLLDTEAGHRLVEQALLQIKYGIYN